MDYEKYKRFTRHDRLQLIQAEARKNRICSSFCICNPFLGRKGIAAFGMLSIGQSMIIQLIIIFKLSFYYFMEIVIGMIKVNRVDIESLTPMMFYILAILGCTVGIVGCFMKSVLLIDFCKLSIRVTKSFHISLMFKVLFNLFV